MEGRENLAAVVQPQRRQRRAGSTAPVTGLGCLTGGAQNV